MISIFLDESGNFEDMNYKVKFIGGLIYYGSDVEEEKDRLENFFKKTCLDLGVEYPRGIHTTEMNGNDSYMVKERLKQYLVNYIRSNPNYYFTFMLSGRNRKTYFNSNFNVVGEKYASNLYDNMIANLIENLIFFNPLLKDRAYNLNVATRIAVVSKNDTQKINEYEEQGYISKPYNNEKIFFDLNNNTSIKSAIASKFIDNKMQLDIQNVDINVERISYKINKGDLENKTTPFLYAADIVCDIIKSTIAEASDPQNKYKNIGDKLRNIKQRDFFIEKITTRLHKINGNHVFAWVYDDIEGLWKDLNLAFYKKDLLLFLEVLYDIKTSNSDFGRFYYDYWCKELLKDIKLIFNSNEIDYYLSKLELFIMNKEFAIYEKGLFIALKIEDFLLSPNGSYKNKYLFKLYDILLRGYNHQGDTNKSNCYISKCKKLKNSVSTFEYIEFMNRELQIYANQFDYDKCIEKAKEIKLCLDVYREAEKEISKYLEKESELNIFIGKVLSSLGQFYAFKENKTLALDYFEKALLEFKDSNDNIKKTTNYLLHLAVAQNDYSLFIERAGEKWMDKELDLLFDEILREGNRFELYLYLKALYTFFLDDISDKLWDRILKTDFKKYKNLGFEITHPWELIFKYMVMISIVKGYEKEAENIISRIDEVFEKGETIQLINHYSRIEIYKLQREMKGEKNKDKYDRKIKNELKDIIKLLDNYPDIKDVFKPLFIDDDTLSFDKLDSIFTYMYK